MNVLKLAAFSHNGQGGNPAGVAFYDSMPGVLVVNYSKEIGSSVSVSGETRYINVDL